MSLPAFRESRIWGWGKGRLQIRDSRASGFWRFDAMRGGMLSSGRGGGGLSAKTIRDGKREGRLRGHFVFGNPHVFFPNSGGERGSCLLFSFLRANSCGNRKFSSVMRRKWPEETDFAAFLCGKTDFPVLFADSDGEQQCAFIAFCLKRPGGDGKMTKRLFFKWKVGTFRFFLSNFVT